MSDLEDLKRLNKDVKRLNKDLKSLKWFMEVVIVMGLVYAMRGVIEYLRVGTTGLPDQYSYPAWVTAVSILVPLAGMVLARRFLK